jgi:hypothetical protein
LHSEQTNGILNAGDDIKVSFNEPIFYNSAISKIEITGRTNQLPIDDNVSLQFSGATSAATIKKPDIAQAISPLSGGCLIKRLTLQ